TIAVRGGSNDIELAQAGQNLDSIAGNLTFAGTGGTDTLVVNDQGSTAGRTYTIHPDGGLGGVMNWGSGVSINLLTPMAAMVVYGGSGNNAFVVSASTNTTVWVVGGSGTTNTLSGDSSTTTGGGFTDDGLGTISKTGYQPIYYFGMSHVDVSGF